MAGTDLTACNVGLCSEVTSTNINKLPNEILLNIFCYLSVEDLALNVQFVCVRWSELCLDEVLWKQSVFRAEENQSVAYILSVLENVPKLQCLEFNTETPEIFHKVGNCCKNLRILIFNCFPTAENIKYLVSECSKLEEITLPDYALCREEVTKHIGKLKNLRAIYPSACLSLDEENTIKLKDIAEGCPCLQCLDMSILKWHYSDVEYFLQRKNKTFASLRISCTSVEGWYVFPLLKMFGRGLQQLYLAGSGLNDNYMDGLSFSAIKTLDNLTSLDIGCGDELRQDDLADIFVGGAMSNLLEVVILREKRVEEKIIKRICSNCPKLQKLELVSRCFEKGGLEYLYKLENLQDLELSGSDTDFDDEIVSNLSDADMAHVARCPKLRRLNLLGSRLTKQCYMPLLELCELRELSLTVCQGAEVPRDLVSLHLKKLIKLRVTYYNKAAEEKHLKVARKLLRALYGYEDE